MIIYWNAHGSTFGTCSFRSQFLAASTFSRNIHSARRFFRRASDPRNKITGKVDNAVDFGDCLFWLPRMHFRRQVEELRERSWPERNLRKKFTPASKVDPHRPKFTAVSKVNPHRLSPTCRGWFMKICSIMMSPNLLVRTDSEKLNK